jgi:curved DNA-binding protein CbpA
MNYYQELGFPKTAAAEEVRRAYRSLARLLHPDQ